MTCLSSENPETYTSDGCGDRTVCVVCMFVCVCRVYVMCVSCVCDVCALRVCDDSEEIVAILDCGAQYGKVCVACWEAVALVTSLFSKRS
jgi:hypothetical protein